MTAEQATGSKTTLVNLPGLNVAVAPQYSLGTTVLYPARLVQPTAGGIPLLSDE